MSDEGVVTRSDVMLDITLQEVTPAAGKGTLGTWRARTGRGHSAGTEPVIKGLGLHVNQWSIGENMSLHLSFIDPGKAAGVHAKVRTVLGKSDRAGSQGGLRKRELWWN